MIPALTFKEEALLAISRLPNSASVKKVRVTIDILAALHEAKRHSAAGRVVSHGDVKRLFLIGGKN